MRHELSRSDRVTCGIGLLQLVCGVAVVVTGGDFQALCLGLVLMAVGVTTYARPWRDRVQYNAGWVRGRLAFALSMVEAQARGMHPVEWLAAEAERDGFHVSIERVEGND